MRINNNINSNINFRGPLDGAVTGLLRTCDMNEMVNAVGLDVGAMVIPRAYYDTKNRNQYAGAETFFREISGTFINCLAAGIFAKWIARFMANKGEVKINPNDWFSKDSMDTLQAAWDGNTKKYSKNVFENLSGRDRHKINNFKDINWKKVDWIDEEKWNNIQWKDKQYKDIQNKLTSKKGFVDTMSKIIEDKNIAESDKNHVLSIMEKRLANALGAERDIELNVKGNKLSARLDTILRDTHDMGKDVFGINGGKDAKKILDRISKVNKTKAFGAIAGASILGLTNQFINRKITEKRTGKKGFVGEVDFTSTFRGEKKKDNLLWLKKLGASAYVIKDISTDFLMSVIRMVKEGAMWIDPHVVPFIRDKNCGIIPSRQVSRSTFKENHSNLTQREYEVLKLVVDGQSNSQIAKTLTISEHTAKAHVCNIIQKLVVDDRTQAAVKALKEGLV